MRSHETLWVIGASSRKAAPVRHAQSALGHAGDPPDLPCLPEPSQLCPVPYTLPAWGSGFTFGRGLFAERPINVTRQVVPGVCVCVCVAAVPRTPSLQIAFFAGQGSVWKLLGVPGGGSGGGLRFGLASHPKVDPGFEFRVVSISSMRCDPLTARMLARLPSRAVVAPQCPAIEFTGLVCTALEIRCLICFFRWAGGKDRGQRTQKAIFA